MNREIVNHILDVLKTSTDKSVILKGLVKLRTDLVKDRDGIVLFNECGGIPPMVRFLKKPHEQILEVVLSILGNCCTNTECCKEAFDSKISIPLATILKSIPNNLIQCRACRLLGNLAKVDNTQLLSSHCPAFASALCQILAENTDVQTQIMCFRACRFLLIDEQFMRHFLLSDGCTLILKILVDVMKIKDKKPIEAPAKLSGLKNTQHRERYFVEVAQHLEGVPNEPFDKDILKSKKVCEDYAMPTDKGLIDLVSEVLKCLIIISEATLNVQSLEAINRTNSLSAIVSFASEKNPFRPIGLKILSNFAKNIDAVPALGQANAIVAACELLLTSEMEKPLTEAEEHHCINVICLLSGDACNRAKIRRIGGIPKLLTIARFSKSQQQISSILYLLNNFQYDLTSMEIMLREGLVGILVSEMDSYMNSDDEYKKKKREEKKNSSRKRKKAEPASETPSSKIQKVREETQLDCESPWSSPRSVASPSSPCSSRSMSPTGSSFKLTSGNDSDSETYSPVCSDDEGADDEIGDDDLKKTDPQESDIMKLLDTACKTDSNMEDNILDKEDDDDPSLVDTPAIKLPKYFNSSNGPIDIIENLFFRLTIVTKKRADLVKVETLKTLVDAIKTFGVSNSLCGSLTNILSESQFFAQIIKTGVASNILELTKVDELKDAGYGFLETLGQVAQSRYGKAELTGLLRLTDINQKRAAIAIACAIKDEQVLNYLLADCNALTILISMILSEDDADQELSHQAVDALTALSRTLGITIPGFKKDLFDSDLVFDENASSPKAFDCDMKFILYENETEIPVTFSKKLLSDVSEVFKLMLNSDFREGKDGEIRLKNYSVNGLKYFLNLIERFTQKKLFNIPSSNQYTSVIEALELSRVYIIPGMEKVIFEIMIYMLNDTNCQGLFEWSMKNYHSQLSEIAINYYLCSNIAAQLKVELFKRAQSSVYSKEWNQMIRDTVLGKCNDTVYYDSEIF